jgi:hypothetical protein
VIGPQLGRDPQRRLDRRVLLGVERHGGADLGRGGADPRDVVRRGLLAEEQPDRGRLDRELGRPVVGQSLGAELAEQLDVLVGDGRGLSLVPGVLAQVVQGDEQAGGPQLTSHPHRVVGRFSRHIRINDGPCLRRGGDKPAQPGTG